MSAAAILSVAARKAAAEGKKVGAAALTLIALVVMSLTVFPGLNRAPSDQMAEAPATSGSNSSTEQGGAIEIAPTPDAGIVDDGVVADVDESEAALAAGVNEPEAASAARDTSSNNADPNSKRRTVDPVKAVLDRPLTSGLVSSDSRTEFLVLDQNYGAFGDNGLTATFTFNPTSKEAFSFVKARITLDGYTFDFEPANLVQISGKNADGSDVFLLVGDATFLYDEFGRKWSETELGKSRIKIEVVMEANGVTVKSIDLVLLPDQ
jgi:RNA polymerase sigma-70 factor (ECF subfamily)